MITDAEGRLSELLHAIPAAPPHEITVDQIRGRVTRQRRNRLAGAGVALAVAAIVVAVSVLASVDTPRGTGPAKRPPARVTVDLGPLLEVTADNQLLLTTGATTGPPPRRIHLHVVPQAQSMVVSNPGGGWIMTYSPDAHPITNQASQRLAWVHPDGSTTAFGPHLDGTTEVFSGLAASPDGTRVAIAVYPTTGSEPARIMVLGTPGHQVTSRTWTLPKSLADEAISLSWSPDGSTLAYIAGTETGDGVYGPPSFLDTTKPGATAPATSPWTAKTDQGCNIPAAAYVGTRGDFDVVDSCSKHRGPVLVPVDPRTGDSGLALPVLLPGDGICPAGIHSTPNVDVSLLDWCDRVYTIRGYSTPMPFPRDIREAVPAGGVAPTFTS
jgi:hypothetical protein